LGKYFGEGHTGEQLDSVIGLQRNTWRYYDSGTGRWISQDPMGLAAGPNLYYYAKNDPTNAIDPTGLLECDDRSFWGTKGLQDISTNIENYVNSVIADARKKYPPGTPDAAQLITRYVYDKLGTNRPGSGVGPKNNVSEITEIEYWLKTNLKQGTQQYQFDFKYSRYGRSSVNVLSGLPALWTDEFAQHMIAPTINVQGILMGTDKWGHFFQQGYWIYDLGLNDTGALSLSMWLEGDKDCYKKPWYPNVREKVGDVLGGPREMDLQWSAILKEKYGASMFFGIFGAASTGVISYADIQANYNGASFYRALAKDPYGYTFNIKNDIPRAILAQWNEQTNKNRFVPGITVDDTVFPPAPAVITGRPPEPRVGRPGESLTGQ
jgi:RHS repeat-associated protein